MMFRRMRALPPKFIALRVVCIVVGAGYVLATTETVQVLRAAFALTKELGAGVQANLFTRQPQPKKQEPVK